MKKSLSILFALAAAVACTETVQPEIQLPVSVEPVITKVTETNFEAGDKIGLSIVKTSGSYAENVALTYDGTAFKGDLKWYQEGSEESSLTAYYPYSQAVPAAFTVQADQSAGTSSSDFLAASKSGVLPSANAVAMVFKHKLTRIVLKVEAEYGTAVESLVLKNVVLGASLDSEFNASATGEAGEVIPFKASDQTYYAIVPPQTVALKVAVKLAGKTLTQNLVEATIEPGKQYTVKVKILPSDIDASISGDVDNWGDGGNLEDDDTQSGEVPFEEFDGYFVYDGARYNTVTLKDGNVWMAQNLHYIPAGMTPSTDPADASGLWYSAANSTKTPSTEAEDVEKLGLLYDAATAFGVSEITAENAGSFEGAQGICPNGWHIPTCAELTGLVGHHSNAALINQDAAYYDATIKGASIDALNADGFNWTNSGAVNCTSTSTKGAYLVTNYGDIWGAMSYVLGSSLYQVTKNTDDSIKNVQYHSFMSTINASNNKVHVAYGNFLSGASVRCVKNK